MRQCLLYLLIRINIGENSRQLLYPILEYKVLLSQLVEFFRPLVQRELQRLVLSFDEDDPVVCLLDKFDVGRVALTQLHHLYVIEV